ncbi:MAG TPA: hypothetical protein VFM37_13515, partial [Pseudonocardiaceae bacterium]|nr:hypothetical protein [Pseudonocardiaceae bacterium]
MPGSALALVDRINAARAAPVLTGEVLPRADRGARARSWLDFSSMLETFSVAGSRYVATVGSGSRTEERIETNFRGLAEAAYKRHGPIFACCATRQQAFSEARFMYRQLRDGRPGDLFSKKTLDILRRPWRGATTGDLLSRMILDADLAGNA